MQLKNDYQENGYARISRQAQHQHQAASLKAKLRTKFYQIVKNVNAKHCVTALILLTLGTIIYYTHYVDNSRFIGLVAYRLCLVCH